MTSETGGNPTPDPCPEEMHGPGARLWARTELYFGLRRPDGSEIDAETWRAFVDETVTPRFPRGLTVTEVDGQWQGPGPLVREQSRILLIIYPHATARESSRKLEEIRRAYVERFTQDSVMREDSGPVCVSF